MNVNKLPVRDICMIGVFVAIISVLSLISIPMPLGVPMTLQTFAVPLAGVILGPRKGMLAAALYVVLGAIGMPVFAGFSGGIGALVGPSGGFINAFPLMAFFAGLGVKKGTVPWIITGLILSILVVYTAGLLQFMLVTGNNLQASFIACVVPFMPTEVAKATVIGTVGIRCRQALVKSGLVTA